MKKLILLFCLIIQSAHADFTPADLKTLITASKTNDSDVLMVWKDGNLLYSYNNDEDKQYSIQSITKSLNAMTVSCILRDEPETLDRPLLFKEWQGTKKADITLKMLLTMTSGIIDPEDPWGKKDFYQHAASVKLTHKPGSVFSYANTSPMIVGKWIKETTGKQFSTHIQNCFFDALNIQNWRIGKDAKGNEVVAGGVRILAQDLLKIGIMLVQNGQYEGQQLFTPEQITEFRKDRLDDGNPYGLSFWLRGKDLYYAAGYLGQYLIMVPSEKLVVLRLRNRDSMKYTKENASNWFKELPGLVAKLVK